MARLVNDALDVPETPKENSETSCDRWTPHVRIDDRGLPKTGWCSPGVNGTALIVTCGYLSTASDKEPVMLIVLTSHLTGHGAHVDLNAVIPTTKVLHGALKLKDPFVPTLGT